MTYERDIVVQLEIWVTWDIYENHHSIGGWSYIPFNPINNSIYDPKAHEAKSDFGLGLSPRAQRVIKSISRVTEILAIEHTEPRNDLLQSKDEVYLLAEPGIQYAAAFPYGGTATIDMEPFADDFQYWWINLDHGDFNETGTMSTEKSIVLTPPDSGHWMVDS